VLPELERVRLGGCQDNLSQHFVGRYIHSWDFDIIFDHWPHSWEMGIFFLAGIHSWDFNISDEATVSICECHVVRLIAA
jgi:hypothetical protein